MKTKTVFENSPLKLIRAASSNGPGAPGNSSFIGMGMTPGSFKKAALLLTCLLGAWVMRADIVQNSIDPFDQEIQVDCDGDGNPEDVLDVSGDLHTLVTETTDQAGGVVDTLHFQPVNVSAVGLLTGDTYRAVGLTRETDIVVDPNQTTTFVNNFYMIGQKSGIKYLVHETAHVTVVDGEVVVSFDHATVSCL
jgi:hypothetical protein